jgi:hypothetical protein
MSILFKLLGAALAIYTIHSFLRGEVYARSFALGKRVFKKDDPNYFLTVIAIYAVLSVVLMTLF